MKISIHAATPDRAGEWRDMRARLWPEATPRQHGREIAAYFAGRAQDPHAALLALDEEGLSVGFAELTLRSHAEGCAPGRVAYLEGWYVEPQARRLGVGRRLMQAAEAWGRGEGCTEFASDAWSINRRSRSAHLALGFQEVGIIRCFRKTLRGPRPARLAARAIVSKTRGSRS